ncbi:hypothetical protein GCM10028801_02820 [Nocardioides maradonensis]
MQVMSLPNMLLPPSEVHVSPDNDNTRGQVTHPTPVFTIRHGRFFASLGKAWYCDSVSQAFHRVRARSDRSASAARSAAASSYDEVSAIV